MTKVAQAASTHRQHQVVCWRGCRLSIVFTCHNVQTPAIEPGCRSNHGSIEGPGLAAVWGTSTHILGTAGLSLCTIVGDQLRVSCSTWLLCRSRSPRVIAAYGPCRTNVPCAFSGRVVWWIHGRTIHTYAPAWASLHQPRWSHSFWSSYGCAWPCFS